MKEFTDTKVAKLIVEDTKYFCHKIKRCLDESGGELSAGVLQNLKTVANSLNDLLSSVYVDLCKRDTDLLREEMEMFEKSFGRPRNFQKLSAEERWKIDKNLGILDWNGKGLTAECRKRMDEYYDD